ncbi:hypothetical protein [Myxosarcina sp. GI1]|uniref:hypothetical protein n=1 Tax=Myxosarcina sp. GI1 TaxID=1541065 RepID=UPI00209FE61A|nr:hypothetical protein [Myxosarcina sp. GI1]
MSDLQSCPQAVSTIARTNLGNKLYSLTKMPGWKVLQKASIKLLWVASLVAVNASVRSLEAHETKVAERVDAAAEIVCLSASGNGYNWASTFAWAAEIVRNAANKVANDARLNVACVSGASSGGAFVATYGSLLQNKQLFNRLGFNPQNITKQEAEILADSLLYMALAADFRPEVVDFYTTIDGNSVPDPPWWKAKFSQERIMLDFGTRVMLAQHISQTDVEQVNKLDRFVRYQTLKELEIAAQNKEIRDEYRQVTFDIWQQSQAILDRLYQKANYQRKQRQKDRDDFRDNLQHPVRQALAKKPADGILALTYAELAFTKSTVDYKKMRSQAPPAETLVPFVFANEATAKTIIESPFYQAQVRQNAPYVGQYVICVVPDYYTMMRHAAREPEMMAPGIYRLSPLLEGSTINLAAGVSYFYQPQAEKNWNSQPQFQLIPGTRFWHQGDKLLNARMGVAGGWVDSYVGGQATLYLGSGYAAKQSNSHLYFSTFSRRDSMGEFARYVVKRYFAPQNSEEAIAKIEKHRNALPTLINRYQQYYGDREISWQPIFVDYEVRFFRENQNLLAGIVSSIDNVLRLGFNYMPAALTKQSNYLVSRTINVVRKTLGTNKDLGYIYDRSYKK